MMSQTSVACLRPADLGAITPLISSVHNKTLRGGAALLTA